MLKKDNFAIYTDIMTKKSNKKGKKTFIALFLFWISKPNIAQASLPQWWIFLFLDVSTLKFRIIIIILLIDQLKIILPTACTTKN